MSKEPIPYWKKLKDPRWQKRRLQILERDKWKCCDCGDTESELQVHHKFYVKGKEPWEYPADALTTLCADCHTEATEASKCWDVETKGYFSSDDLWSLSISFSQCQGVIPSTILALALTELCSDQSLIRFMLARKLCRMARFKSRYRIDLIKDFLRSPLAEVVEVVA